MNKDLSSLYAERRSVYNLGNRQILPETEISGIIADALKFCPSAFNSQSARVVVLYGDYYRKLWDIVLTELSKVVPEDKMPATIEKIKTFSAGLGTVLFLKTPAPLKACRKNFRFTPKTFPNGRLNQTACCNI